jgi:hypothetical protein
MHHFASYAASLFNHFEMAARRGFVRLLLIFCVRSLAQVIAMHTGF